MNPLSVRWICLIVLFFSEELSPSIYLTKILTSKSLPEIGREFSNRDHTTIIHSVKTIEKLKEKDLDMVDNINKLKNQILYNNN